MMTALKPRHRIPELDGLRAVAILSVIIHHALHIPLLWMGVDLFFVLSGFLITGILLDRKKQGSSYFRYFYQRRARRILPPLALLLLISSCLFGIGWMKHWYWYAFFSTNIAVVLGQAGHPSLQPLWSLAVEEQFYLVWPLVILLVSERTLVRAALAVVFLTPVLRGYSTHLYRTHFPIYFLTPYRMDLLCAGALLAVAWERDRSMFQKFRIPAHATALAALLLLVWLSRYPQFRTSENTVVANTFLYSIILILVTSALIIALSGQGTFCWALRLPAMRYIGIISYSMYLIHTTVILLCRRVVPNPITCFAASLGVTILYASATWYGFEKRLLHPRKARLFLSGEPLRNRAI